jgi:hypothetical protein
MTCPGCQIDFNPGHWGECPHCGNGKSGFIKTSTILISAEDGGVFRSLDEVPETLRKTLVKSTSSPNSATIVIADQAGRARLAEQLALRAEPPVPAGPRGVPLVAWLGLAGAGLAGAAAWLLSRFL